MRPSRGGLIMLCRKLSAFLTCLFLSGAVLAQTLSVSNSDLSKFRDRRISAEKEYRENYLRLGMPSPEQIEKDRIAYIANTQELSARLRREAIEREAREAALIYESAVQRQTEHWPRTIGGPVVAVPYFSGYYTSYGYRYQSQRPRQWYKRPISWRAAGGLIFYEPGGRPSTIWNPTTVRRSSNVWRIRK